MSDRLLHAWESPHYEPLLPVSEKSNPLTRDIDRASSYHIMRMLQACDAQMFEDTGAEYERIFSDRVVETLLKVAQRVEQILKDPQESLVVLSGCGTSGRLAFLIASGFNKSLKQLKQKSMYRYIIAGGDKALLSSQEAPEDDPTLGMLSLKKICEGKKRVLFIGISCGLSAPFVAGQLDFCMQHPEVYTPVLVGFNPSHQARDEAIQGCTLTFRSVVQRMEELSKTQKAFLLNPAVGPEAISGSSRMKGGSATKILLEVLFSAAHAAVFANTPVTSQGIREHLEAYRQTLDVTYAHVDGITTLLEAAGQSLRHGRRVCYLGWGSVAVLGLIDASECIPTFGADFEDVRGFISGGYDKLDNNEGSLSSLNEILLLLAREMTHLPPLKHTYMTQNRIRGPDFCISHEDFVQHVLPSLDDRDMILLIYTHSDDVGDVAKLARRVREKSSNLHAVYHQTEGAAAAAAQDDINKMCSSSLKVTWPSASPGNLLHMWELSTKLVLNAVSTGGHVLKGKIYQNYMIDVQVTNSKLYRRARRLLEKLSGRSESQCEEALLQSIYQTEELTADITSSDISKHTQTARNRSKVVPCALLCLLTGCSLQEAETRLEEEPIVREAVVAHLLE